MAAAGVGLPAGLLRRGEADVHRGADWIVRIEHRLDGAFFQVAGHDPPGDALAGGVRETLVQELGGPGAALADKVVLQPLARDPLELAEQVQLRFLAGVAPLGLQEPLGEVEDQSGRTHFLEMLQAQVHAFADDALVSRDRGSDQVGGELQGRVVVESGRQPFLGQLDAVPLHARKSDLARIALRRNRLDLDRLARRRLSRMRLVG